MAYADLELSLHRREGADYAVEFRFSQPDSEAEVRPITGDSVQARINLQDLRQLMADDRAYGQDLSDGLFSAAAVRSAFAAARAATLSQKQSLRLRLFIGPSAPELHNVRWETLRDPERDAPLLTGENLVFSRYLSAEDWRPVRLRPKARLKALIVVANPSNLPEYDLAPVDVAGELGRARQALDQVALTELAAPGQATLNAMVEQLRQGYDILYLTAHGSQLEGQPWLWLEKPDGSADKVAGSEFATRLNELSERPRLVVLASCQSAGTGQEASSRDKGILAALGPRLAAAGVPAVVAMQGNVSMQTAAEFMPVFFRELQKDGLVDRAMSVARGAVRKQPDWWTPALFMRLKSGRLWYTPGFGEDRESLKKWPALLSNISTAKCTPILGPGLAETLLGSRKDIARRWAETYHFPMAAHEREDLPQVAQFLDVQQQWMFPRAELAAYLHHELLQRLNTAEGDPLRRATLDELITALGERRQAGDEAEPHRVLASLPLPIFITTDPSSLLEEALRRAGKSPEVEICRWNANIEMLPSVFHNELDYVPSEERPLVYHLFGQMQHPDSVVLTEDDYFDYLIGVTSNKELIPPRVRRFLADTSLLFLGFRLDEWDFRVLYRSIMSQEGRQRRNRYAHIAAQIDPEEGRILEPERAREYLESYFQESDISIYWGNAEDFLRELQQRWQER